MSDELSTVVDHLQTAHNSALVVVHDERTAHIGYWDTNARAVDEAVLRYVHEQDFRVVQAGQDFCGAAGRKCGWAEFRRHDPRVVYKNGGERQ